MDYSNRVSQLLQDCEDIGIASKYGKPKVSFSSRGKEIFILSDLHLTFEPHAGRSTKASEKSLTDLSFIRFIKYIQKQILPNSGVLVINGDFIDFLRIIRIPENEEDFSEWQKILKEIGINKEISFLKSSISRREIRYGLNTSDYKSVWKLNLVVEAHLGVFDALAEWLFRGNKLIIVKGNHDLELYWPAVRNFIRLYLGQILNDHKESGLEVILRTKVLPNLLFVDDSLIVDEKYYIEHGHKFDKYCSCIGGPLLKNNEELNIPFGSFFNRYLLNHVEIAHPPFKNVREKKNILPLLIEKRFFLGIRALLQHIPVLFLIIPMRYYRYLFGRVLLIVLTMFLPVLYIMDKFWNIVEPVSMKLDSAGQTGSAFSKFLKIPGLNMLENLVFSFISFVVSRSGAYMALEEPSTLSSYAKRKFAENPYLKIISFGHTHNSESFEENGREFFNTGAWLYSPDEANHLQNNFTYLHIESNSLYKNKPGIFLKWNSYLNCPEPVELNNKKESYLKVVGE